MLPWRPLLISSRELKYRSEYSSQSLKYDLNSLRIGSSSEEYEVPESANERLDTLAIEESRYSESESYPYN